MRKTTLALNSPRTPNSVQSFFSKRSVIRSLCFMAGASLLMLGVMTEARAKPLPVLIDLDCLRCLSLDNAPITSPSNSCTGDNFQMADAVARVRGARIAGYIVKSCAEGRADASQCSVYAGEALYRFSSVKFLINKPGLQGRDLIGGHEYNEFSATRTRGIFLDENRDYIAAIKDTRQLFGYGSIILACELR